MKFLMLALLLLPWPCWGQTKDPEFVRDSNGFCFYDSGALRCVSAGEVYLYADYGDSDETSLRINSGSPGVVSTTRSFEALGSITVLDILGVSGTWFVGANSTTGNALYYVTGDINHHVFGGGDVQIPDGLFVGTNGTEQVEVITGTASIDFGTIAAATSATASDNASASVLNLTANMACACSPRAEYDDDYIPKRCYSSAGTLNVVVYNALAVLGPDPAAVTVDFKCTAHP